MTEGVTADILCNPHHAETTGQYESVLQLILISVYAKPNWQRV